MNHALVLLMFLAQIGWAQAVPDAWLPIRQLRTGDHIEVHVFEGKKSKGSVTSVSDTEIKLTARGRDVVFDRQKVNRVKDRRTAGRLRNGLIGAAIGGGAAAMIGLAFSSNYGEGSLPSELIVGVAALGSAIGLGAGMIAPGYRTIFIANSKARP